MIGKLILKSTEVEIFHVPRLELNLFHQTIHKICMGVVVILLLNIMDVFNVGRAALLDRPCMIFQRMCVLCL